MAQLFAGSPVTSQFAFTWLTLAARCFAIVCTEGNHALSAVSCSEAEEMTMIRSCSAVWHCMPGEFSYSIRRPRNVSTSPLPSQSIFRTYFRFSEVVNRKRIHGQIQIDGSTRQACPSSVRDGETGSSCKVHWDVSGVQRIGEEYYQ